MSQESRSRYEFQSGIPVAGVEPGTNLLVRGPSSQGAREVALRLITDGTLENDAALLVSSDVGGQALLDRCDEACPGLDRSRLGIVDCAGVGWDDQHRFQSFGDPIDDPGDLTGIEIELSTLYETLAARNVDGVRVGLFSVSSLLAHSDLRPVSRFVHMLTGRVIATDDLGVFLVDAAALDDRLVQTIEQFCDGSIEVRGSDDTYELRVTGLEDQPDDWTSVAFES